MTELILTARFVHAHVGTKIFWDVPGLNYALPHSRVWGILELAGVGTGSIKNGMRIKITVEG